MKVLGSTQFPTTPQLSILPTFVLPALVSDAQNPHLSHVVDLFNKFVSQPEVISADAITASPIHQRLLSKDV